MTITKMGKVNTITNAELPKIEEISEDGTKVIEGEFHTLFVSKEEHRMDEFQTEYNGEVFTAVKESVPEHKKFTLYVEQFGHNKNQLHKVMNELRQGMEHDVLELRIDSPGGYISEGIMIYNVMREVFNGRTTTYLDSTGFSMGAMIFSLGDERVAYDDSSLMYHNYSTGYSGKGGEIKSYIDFEDKHFREFFINKIVNKGFLTQEEYKDMSIGQDFWMDSMELAKRGIATHIIIDGFKLDADAYIKFKEQKDISDIEEWTFSMQKAIETETVEENEQMQKALDTEEKRMSKIMKQAEKIVDEQEAVKSKKLADKKTKKKPTVKKKKTSKK